ncbi:MAG: ADP-ribosylglycohydrolase family protein [Kofleriaceae bacterium]
MHWLAPADREHGLGALWGLALGDALGTTLEFTAPAAPPFPTLATGPVDAIVGGGPFGLAPGLVTDDTQLAAAVAQSLLAHGGDLDLHDLAARFVTWSQHAFDIGSQIGAVIRRLGRGDAVDEAARAVWLERDRDAAGNGALMRAAPLAVAYCTRPDALVDAALAEAGLTHWDPRCRLASVAYDAAIAAAVAPGGTPTAPAMVAAARAALDEAAARLDAAGADRDRVTAAHAALTADLDHAGDDDPDLYGDHVHLLRHQGFVRVAFRLAFWHLSHTRGFTAAVVDATNRGGDADTNAAIVGALLGARDGLASLPSAWIAQVDHAVPADPALAAAYHPRALVALCG